MVSRVIRIAMIGLWLLSIPSSVQAQAQAQAALSDSYKVEFVAVLTSGIEGFYRLLKAEDVPPAVPKITLVNKTKAICSAKKSSTIFHLDVEKDRLESYAISNAQCAWLEANHGSTTKLNPIVVEFSRKTTSVISIQHAPVQLPSLEDTSL